MLDKKKLRILRVTVVVILIIFLLSPFFKRLLHWERSSVAAASFNKIFFPFVIRDVDNPLQTTNTESVTPSITATFTGTSTATQTATPTYTLTATATFTPTATATSTPGIPQESLFGVGMNNVTVAGGVDQIAEANISWVRLPGVQWSSVETVQGIYDWSVLAGLESELQTASSKGIQVILLVHSTQEWARKTAGTGPSCGPIAADKLAAFGDFMRAMVARYSVAPYNVKYWELWNEEDVPFMNGDNGFGCWGEVSDLYFGGGYFAEMLKVVYPQIKAADSQAQVLIGGLLLDCDPSGGCTNVGNSDLPLKFLEGILRNNGGLYFDGVSFHAYDYYLGAEGQYSNPNWTSAWNTSGSSLVPKSQFIKSILNQYSVTGKFLMNTETALICGTTGQEAPCLTDLFANTKAYYVTQTYAAAIAQGLRASLWYNVFGWRGSGLLNADLSAQPAYTALKFAVSELTNTAYVGVVVPSDIGGVSGVKGYKFQSDNRRVWVLWSLDGSAHLCTFSSVPLAVWDALGNPVTSTSSMNIALNPIYLEWNP
jgi:hypothetical protein